MDAIPNLDEVISKSVICRYHFKSTSSMIDPSIIFKNTVLSKQNKRFVPKYMFEISSRDSIPDISNDLHADEFVQNLENFKAKYGEKLKIVLQHWQVINSNYSFFYSTAAKTSRIMF